MSRSPVRLTARAVSCGGGTPGPRSIVQRPRGCPGPRLEAIYGPEVASVRQDSGIEAVLPTPCGAREIVDVETIQEGRPRDPGKRGRTW